MDDDIFDNFTKAFIIFYNMIWLKTPNGKKIKLNIPDTIIIKNYCLDHWYFTNNEGYVMRKNNAKVSPKIIVEEFLAKDCRKKKCEVIAQFLYPNTDKTRIIIEYFTKENLKEQVYRSMKQKKYECGVLQMFVEPSGDHETTVQANWTPHVTLMTQRENVKFIYNKHNGIYDRFCTFDGPDYFSKQCPVSAVYSGKVKEICESIVEHFAKVSKETQMILRLSLNFKINSDCNLVLLFCGNMYLDEGSWINSKNHNHYNKTCKNNQKADLLPPSCPEDMEYNFNLKIHQTHYQPKKILCLQCNELKIENCFVEVENHIIILAHYKQRAEKESCNKLIQLDTLSNEKKLKESNDPRSKMNWLHSSCKNVMEEQDGKKDPLITDYLKMESQIPGIFRKLRMKYSQFQKEKNSNQFLFEKSYVCDKCYDLIISSTLYEIEKKHLQIMFSNMGNKKHIPPGRFLVQDDIKANFFDKYNVGMAKNNANQEAINFLNTLDTNYITDIDKKMQIKKINEEINLNQSTKKLLPANNKFDYLYGNIDPRQTTKTLLKKTVLKDIDLPKKIPTRKAPKLPQTENDFLSKGKSSKNTLYQKFFKDLAAPSKSRSKLSTAAQVKNPTYSIYNESPLSYDKQRASTSANLRQVLISNINRKTQKDQKQSMTQTTRNTAMYPAPNYTVFSEQNLNENKKLRITTSANLRHIFTKPQILKKTPMDQAKSMSQTARNFKISKDNNFIKSAEAQKLNAFKDLPYYENYSNICPKNRFEINHPHLLESSKGIEQLNSPNILSFKDNEFFDNMRNPEKMFLSRKTQLKSKQYAKSENTYFIEDAPYRNTEGPPIGIFFIFIFRKRYRRYATGIF